MNDLEFGGILGACARPHADLTADCFARAFTDLAGQTHATLRAFLQLRIPTLPATYQTLKDELRDFGAGNPVPTKRVLMTEYPDTLQGNDGQLCPGLDLSAATGSVVGLNVAEVIALADEFRTPLNAAIAATANPPSAWTTVSLGGGFDRHGYCAADHWVVTRAESYRNQGEKFGTLHPNRAGHRWIGRAVAKALEAQLLPGGKPRKPAK